MSNPESPARNADKLLQPASLDGLVMVIGAADTGKSTLARLLYSRLVAAGRRVAFLDGDPGQSSLGPPATLSLAFGSPGADDFPPPGPVVRRFVGSVSPRGHYLPLLAAAARLIEAARGAGAQTILYDTTGQVSMEHGGLALKLAKIEILKPSTVIAIQAHDELRSLLRLVAQRSGLRLVSLRPVTAVRRRDREERRAHRAQQFAAYFATARPLALDLHRYLVWPRPVVELHQLVAMEDAEGLALGLGIVLAADLASGQLVLLTPLATMAGVQTLNLGDLAVDPRTFRDQALMTH